jgi:hypothetical protein
MHIIPLNLVFEDQVSEFVMIKLAEYTKKFYISYSFTEGGFGYIKKNIRGWNQAAKGCPFFILTDLDKSECAPMLIKEWLQQEKHPNLIFRVAVKEVEAWLLSDIEGFSKFSGVPVANFVEEVEAIADAKNELLRLIKRSKKRYLKEDILPKDDFAKIGPNYNERLCDFIINHWSIERAIKRSDSLKKALAQLSNFKEK